MAIENEFFTWKAWDGGVDELYFYDCVITKTINKDIVKGMRFASISMDLENSVFSITKNHEDEPVKYRLHIAVGEKL